MSTFRKVDPSTLGWVKSEIDETLKQARLALEGFVENPSDRAKLRFCITHLHQVVGTLLMVELDGAAMMAREIETLAESVHDDKVKATPEVLDVLTRGILVLPDYLARLQFGNPDVPLKHLPLLNEMRAARSAEPVSELEFFQPDLSVRPPASPAARERLADAEFAALARSKRPAFQGALLSWLRDANDKESLRTIAAVIEELQLAAGMAVLEQLFWVAGGLLEGMIDGGLEPTPERKKHMARLDQQVKKIVDGTEKSVLRSSSEVVVRTILFELAQVEGGTPKIKQLKQVFALDALLGRVEQAAASDDQTSPEVLESVARALAKEIEQAQDMVSAAFETRRTDAASLAPLRELLHKMAGTLEMMALPLLQQLVEEISAVCEALAGGRIATPEVAAMPIAQALLLIENGARDLQHGSLDDWKKQINQTVATLHGLQTDGDVPSLAGIEVTESELSETDYKQLLSVVANEIGVNLGKIEEAFEGFAANPTQLQRLDEVSKQLAQIQGALQVLGVDRVVELSSATRQHIENIRRGTLAIDPAILDGLAVCIGTIGAYIDGLRVGRKNLDPLIESALREMQAAAQGKAALPVSADPLEALQATLEAWLTGPENQTALAQVQDALSDAASVATRDPMKFQRILTEMDRLLELVASDASALSGEVIDTLRACCDALGALRAVPSSTRAPAAAASPASKAAAPVKKPAVPEEFDEEIMQIFIEDARDVIGNLQREFPSWRSDTDNAAALAELRRGFHTLKGSGRMVGASEIAELAWAVEHLLNHIRDGKMAATPEAVNIVERAYLVMPALVAQLEGAPAPDVDIEALRNQASDLAERRGAPAPATPRVVLPKLDGTLLDIFTNEARAHVGNINEVVASCRDAGGTGLASAGLTRSIHTLQGNARSLGIPMMAEACAELEKLLQDLRRQQIPLSDVHLGLLDQFAHTVDGVIQAVMNGEENAGELLKDFDAIMRGAHAAHGDIGTFEALAPAEVYDDIGGDIELIAPPAPDDGDSADLIAPPVTVTIAPIPGIPSRPVAPIAPARPVVDTPVDPELLDIFREEAADILNTVERTLRQWRAEPENMGVVLELKRGLHTLKGGARMASQLEVGEVSHHTESLLMQVESRNVSASPALYDLLEETHDLLVSMLNRIGQPQPTAKVESLIARLATATSGAEIPERASMRPPAPTAPAAPVARAGAAEAVEPGDGQAPEADTTVERRGGDRQSGQIRVKTDLLNNLVNYAGEVSISRARMEQQIYGFRDNLGELRRNVVRFREQLRELEIQSESQILYRVESGDSASIDFDPLEFDRFSKLQQLTRSLTESLHDLTTIQLNMGNFVGEAETVLQQQARLNTELQEGLMRTRMVEFDTQAARLRHIVRETARELGKRAELDIVGTEVQIDRTVLERMIGPFEHMIRNALDHGLESESDRIARGKPTTGRITLTVTQEGSEIVIRFADDGAGMNLDKIRAKAVERGLITAGASLTDDDILQFVLLSGFSTADTITQVSGRGVGMDVVHSEVKQLGGSMVVDTKLGKGTTFVIRLPLTLSITQALMAYVGEQQFAIPIASISNIIECPLEQLSQMSVGNNPLLKFNDQLYSFMSLGTRLGIPPVGRLSKKVPVLLARAGVRDVAMQVDSLGGTREIVIKPLSPQLVEVPGLAGATIMGDGRVVLILDLPGLWHAEDVLVRVEHARAAPVEEEKEVRERPIIMVVDDSLTVRKITGKHLQKRGFDVLVAKDGVDAVEQLRSQVPDLMLVDIEMPRMDGYELTGRVRGEVRLRHVPIIMITSRAGAKHRQKAFELGVDLYMSKPYQEDELFSNIDTLLASGRKTR